MSKSNPESPDDPPRELSAELDGQPVRFVSRPGIPAWDRVTPAEALLAAQVQAAPAARLLLLGCGHGATQGFISQPWQALAPGGQMLLAANRFIPSERGM